MNATRNRNSTCRSCNVRRVPSRSVDPDAHGIELCRPCLVESEQENTHYDYGHEGDFYTCTDPECIGAFAPEHRPITSAPKAPSLVRNDNGLHVCPMCNTEKPSNKFPTRRVIEDGRPQQVRDLRGCRQCRAAK